MDIILARSPDFDAVISQESSDGKGDREKEDQEGLKQSLLIARMLLIYSAFTFFGTSAKRHLRQPCALSCRCQLLCCQVSPGAL